MTACSMCGRNFFSGVPYYEDDKVAIVKADPRYGDPAAGDMLGVFKAHETPTKKEREWMEIQVKIVARRKFGMNWGMKYEGAAHPHYRVFPKREAKARRNSAFHEPTGAIGKLS